MNYNNTNVLVENRADPFILKHSDGYYYFTATVPRYDKIILRKSKTISGLTEANEVTLWVKHDSGEMSSLIWAPEIHYFDNSWYIYFAAKDSDSLDHFGDSAHKMYVLECKDQDPINGLWNELGQIKANWESFSLDATTFEHKNQRYLVWAQKDDSIDGNSNIYIAKMKTAHEIDGEQVLLTKPELPWEIKGFKVNEGPAILKMNDKIILSYSGSATDANYSMGFLIADEDSDLLCKESWIKSDKPFRKTNTSIMEFGPGHNCFTYDEDGLSPLIVYHARDYEKIVGDPLLDVNRHTKITKFSIEI